MQVHEIPYGTKVKITDASVSIPPGAPLLSSGEVITIFKLDGMYCNGENESGDRIYVAAWTNVDLVD